MSGIVEEGEKRRGDRKFSYTLDDVGAHCVNDDVWVAYEGNVYDVTNFSNDHPGGVELILQNAGSDITETFNALHKHSNYALDLLKDYQIGVLARHTPKKRGAATPLKQRDDDGAKADLAILSFKDDSFLNLNEPLMPQVLGNTWSKRYYLEQVHIPRYTSFTPRFFRQDWLEVFTKTAWWGIPLFWLPIILGSLWFAGQSLGVATVVRLFLDGLILWTVYEYVFHRFVFHLDAALPDHPLAFAFHFLMHGVHHFLPMDRYRLVMPPVLLLTLSLPVVTGLRWMLGWPSTAATLAGSYTGYLAYDIMHYYFHHGGVVGGYVGRMKTYHMDHHYVDPNLGFGVSNLTWDAAFDTLLPLRR